MEKNFKTVIFKLSVKKMELIINSPFRIIPLKMVEQKGLMAFLFPLPKHYSTKSNLVMNFGCMQSILLTSFIIDSPTKVFITEFLMKFSITNPQITEFFKELRSKFNNNSHSGIFLGYSNNTNGYKLYYIINNKIILARTVEFMENEPGNSFINKYFTNNEFRESVNIKKLNQHNYYNKTDNKKNKTNEYILNKNINSNNQKDTNTYKNINQYINKHNEKNNNSSNTNHNDYTTIINKTNISAIRNESTNNNNVQHNTNFTTQ